MFEIEAKVRLKAADLKRLRKQIPQFARFKKNSLKKDHYYGTSKRFFVRLRQKKDETNLNIKEKIRGGGFELNPELKIEVASFAAFERCLTMLGIPKTDCKEKHSEIYHYKNFQIELNHIKGLGDFLEIEILVKNKKQIPRARQSLTALFKSLGFSPRQFERKYYLELLNHV